MSVSYEQFNYSNPVDRMSRIKVTATIDAVIKNPDQPEVNGRYWIRSVSQVMAVLDGGGRIRHGSTATWTYYTRVSYQTFGDANNVFSKYRVFVIESSGNVEIRDVATGNLLRTLQQGQWVDINCDANGNMQNLSPTGSFSATSLPPGSATLYSDMDTAFQEIEQ